jgi:hypothetical protein
LSLNILELAAKKFIKKILKNPACEALSIHLICRKVRHGNPTISAKNYERAVDIGDDFTTPWQKSLLSLLQAVLILKNYWAKFHWNPCGSFREIRMQSKIVSHFQKEN